MFTALVTASCYLSTATARILQSAVPDSSALTPNESATPPRTVAMGIAVETVEPQQHRDFARFLTLANPNSRRQSVAPTERVGTVHLNPIHAWAVQTPRNTNGLDDAPAVRVLLYAATSDAGTVELSDRQERLVRTLERQGPTNVRRLVGRSWWPGRGASTDDLDQLCRAGVIAVA